MNELALGDTVTIHDESVWLVATGGFVEHDQELAHHRA